MALNTRRLPIVALLLALVSSAVALAACGGGGGGGGGDVDKVLNETFSGSKKVHSGKLDLSLNIKLQGGTAGASGPVAIKLSGPFESQGTNTLPQFDFDLSLSAAGRTFTAGAVSTGNAGFLKFQGQSYSVPANVFAQFKQGYERSQAQSGNSSSKASFGSLGIDPRNWLKDAKSEGDADVGGTSTDHVSASVDVPKLLDDVNKALAKAGQLGGSQTRQLPNQLTEQQRKAIEDAVEDAKFDVYSGKDDKILRRLTVTLKFKVPENQQAQAQGLSGGEVTFDLQLTDLNQSQSISAPLNPKSFQELTQAIRGALGGLAGIGGAGTTGGTTTGGATGGTTTPSTGGSSEQNAQAYLKCVQQAGGDVAKAQKCASLLNGG